MPARSTARVRNWASPEGQLRDHEARIGRAFTHDGYLAELAGLRDLLKAGLSQAAPAPGSEAVPVTELAGRIKALKAAHTIDAAPERTVTRRIAAELPVTARIRRRSVPAQAVEPPSPAETSMDEAITPGRPRRSDAASGHPSFPGRCARLPGQAAARLPTADRPRKAVE